MLVNEAATRKALFEANPSIRLGDGAFLQLNEAAAAIVQYYTTNTGFYPVQSRDACDTIVLKPTLLERTLKAGQLAPEYRRRVANCICYVLRQTIDLAVTIAATGIPVANDLARAFAHVWASVRALAAEPVVVKVPRSKITVTESPDQA